MKSRLPASTATAAAWSRRRLGRPLRPMARWWTAGRAGRRVVVPSRPGSTAGTAGTAGSTAATTALLALGGLAVLALSPGQHMRLDDGKKKTADANQTGDNNNNNNNNTDSDTPALGVWFRDLAAVDWSTATDRLAGMLLPDWSRMVPGFVRKLQRELSTAPGSLADEIWREARDPAVHPEVAYAAQVRVAPDGALCPEEAAFCARRQAVIAGENGQRSPLAEYLGLPPDERVHPDDVPVIALCGSGGGLRALVAGTGSLMAAADAGLFGCATYTAGVSGSCWLQALYFASFARQDFRRVADHLRARLGVHMAHPPEAFALLTAAPTNKYLLSGSVERFKADPAASFGLVDVYGTLLAARLLVPRGELAVSPLDFKISSQRRHLARGQQPLPIYTAVRHEIPGAGAEAEGAAGTGDAAAREAADQAADQAQPTPWFQWFEITPYEFFCEEFAAGIPTWALGRTFRGGRDVPNTENTATPFRLPEVRMPLMLGIFGSAFCATLQHYYKEIRPLVRGLAGMGSVDEMIWGRSADLGKVHPIEPAALPNPVYGMDRAQLPATVPSALLARPRIQLMDAGMSNNLPLYPFLRPARGVEVAVVFDASADIRQDNWLNVADGYARRRGVQGWPVGVGWPPADAPPAETARQLDEARAPEAGEGEGEGGTGGSTTSRRDPAQAQAVARELGFCSVWVGSTEETVSTAAAAEAAEAAATSSPPHLPPIDESTQWRLTAPDAGLTLVYLPYLANPARVPGVDPATSDFMSTWNFVWTPDEIDRAVALAQANFAEGAEQIRATVRAVYERKKQRRLAAAAQRKAQRRRRRLRLGQYDKVEGDLFTWA